MAAPPGNGRRVLRIALVTTGLLLPALTLVPLGSLWLWQNGYLLYWSIGILTFIALVVSAEWWLLSPEVEAAKTREEFEMLAAATSHEGAQQAVEAYAASLKPSDVQGDEAFQQLALETISRVARHLHPGETNPVWNFTVPEALALTERVASRLRPIVMENVPLGSYLTVKQVMRLYEWRAAVGWAERAYDVWRLVRVLNPAAAITQEARERLTKTVYRHLKDEFTVRLAQAYVREVGRAAIDLYSGRLKSMPHAPATPIEPATADISQRGLSATLRQHGRKAWLYGRSGAQWLLRRRR